MIDTNVVLAGLVSESSASQRLIDAMTGRRAILLLSRPVLTEYRAILMHPKVSARFRGLTARRVSVALERLRYLSDYHRSVNATFELPRDPNDAMFIELAIAGHATHIVTLDADLLSLPAARTNAGKRFRQRLPLARIVSPSDLIAQHHEMLDLPGGARPA